MYAYLDLNIFDRIEKLDSLENSERGPYEKLRSLILEEKLISPYSNAHLNDLHRGFLKNPDYIDGHLTNIKALSKNLCICQYWNESNAKWHYRDIFEFFEEKKEDVQEETLAATFASAGIPASMLDVFKVIPLEPNWKDIYAIDPMFGLMFPRSKNEDSVYAVMEDIYAFQMKLQSDYSLYRKFKAYLSKSMAKIKANRKYFETVNENFKDLPKHLEIDHVMELYAPKNDQLKNKAYSKILDVFFKHDLKGYKTDANYNNMFDDSLHTFYAAHCDFFITNDDRCHYKAQKTYERVGIKTKVLKANEISIIENCL